MPPPNFARKKRKSRSRGASAKRASHTRSQPNQKSDKRSSSFDVSSGSSRDVKEVINVQNSTLPTSESETSPLSHNVAALASVSSGTTIKKHPSSHSQKKTSKSSDSGHCSNFQEGTVLYNSNTQDLNLASSVSTSIMGQEDEKLNNLCRLLERLDSTYGKYSNPNSPSKAKGDTISLSFVQNGEITDNNSQKIVCIPVSPQAALSCNAKKIEEKPSNSNDLAQENSLTPAEKQALRKAKKEAKKLAKTSKADPEATSVSVKSCTTGVSPLASQNIKQESNQTVSVATSLNPMEKSKAELRRERREKQEAQRASKEAEKAKQNAKKTVVIATGKGEIRKNDAVVKKTLKPKGAVALCERHLPLLEHLSTSGTDNQVSLNSPTVHPAIRAAGLSMKDFTVDGCLSRTLATLSAICSLIEDYQTPPSCDLSRDLSNQLSPNIAFLHACRPISEPLNNAIRFVKREVNKVPSIVPEMKAKQDLLEAIQTYIYQNIILASEAIINNAQDFIEDHDVILTFGFSSLVLETVKAASKSEKEKLSVIVVDNPGTPSGIYLLQSLIKLGVKVYYRILPDLLHIINKVTKVVVEAEAVVLNGAVIGRCGMSGLILLASAHSVPVIVLSHTFKFCNIDLTDSLVVNELGSSADIVDCPSSFNGLLADWKDVPSLNVVNLIYDVTPSQLISVLVTELNNFPTSVVPVIIKRNYADILGHD